MNHNTQTVLIEAEPKTVIQFVADGANLPRWAIGFAQRVEPAAGDWLVTTGSGDVIRTSIIANDDAGTVDFVMSPAPEVFVTAWTRTVALNGASLFSFTQAQPPNMPDEIFEMQVDALAHELVALKALLEVTCPL